ncbi:MAG TPA: hypothetical protein VG496_14125 [Myxococcales bacterium]|nr:hypothetical protein [Myxococcales bacterium]
MGRKRERKPEPAQALLELARRHEAALVAAGLSPAVLEDLESALRRMDAGSHVGSAAEVLIRDVLGEISEIQAAIRKEFPNNEAFQSVFKANEPLPAPPGQLLALARLIAREAPGYAANLIKYAINAATVRHLSYLCDQLEKELASADPKSAVRAAEERIRAAATRAFAGKPELDAFVAP